MEDPLDEIHKRELAKDRLSRFLQALDVERSDEAGRRRKIAVWGTGAAARSYLDLHPGVVPDMFIESVPRSKVYLNRPVLDPVALPSPQDVFIVVCTDALREVTSLLEERGFANGNDFVNGDTHPQRLHLYSTRANFARTVDWLNENVRYIEARGRSDDERMNEQPQPEWGKFVQETIDILIFPEDIPTILACPHISRVEDEILFDFQWSPPLGLPGELPMFSWSIRTLLHAARERNTSGIYVVNKEAARLLYAYHMVIHKAELSGLPVYDESDPSRAARYAQQGARLYPGVQLSVTFLAEELRSAGVFPPAAEVQIWAEALGSEFLRSQTVPNFPGAPIVFMLRGRVSEIQRNALRETLRDLSLVVERSWVLTPDQQMALFRHARGGVWNENAASLAAGLPSEIMLCRLPEPQIGRDLVTGAQVKAAARAKLIDTEFDPSRINWVHSTDNPTDAEEVLALLEKLSLPQPTFDLL